MLTLKAGASRETELMEREIADECHVCLGSYLYDHSSSDKEIVGRGAGERPAVEKMC